jgi:hypothetical protein
MFGRQKPEAKTTGKPTGSTETERITSYRVDQDAAPPTGTPKTTSYVNALQRNGRGYETLN